MIQLLSRWLIPDRDNVSSPAVRRAYGTLCGAVGIALNILLFAGKFFAGQLSGSIAVTADAFNNLSDAGSSAVTLLGFRLAGKKPDTDHPFGHGRIEYISGLIVAGLILLMGVELAKSSLDKILHPEEVTFSPAGAGDHGGFRVREAVHVAVQPAGGTPHPLRRHGSHRHGQPVRHGQHLRRAGGYAHRQVDGAGGGRLCGSCGGAVHPVLRVQGRP